MALSSQISRSAKEHGMMCKYCKQAHVRQKCVSHDLCFVHIVVEVFRRLNWNAVPEDELEHKSD
jgi:hypothetical protein